MVVKFDVKFDNNPNGIYFAGQTLSGIVELTINKPKKLRGLKLNIEGFAKIQWTEADGAKKHYQKEKSINDDDTSEKNKKENLKVVYSGREDYMHVTTYLIGGPEGNPIEIAPGSYQYNFQAALPALLPTSFEAKYGSIRYIINVVFERPWKSNITYKVGFTVLKHLDLNYENPALKIPTKMETQKSFYCGICRTNPLLLMASIPMSGFVSGQGIPVSIQINNQSSIDVDQLKVSLMKIVFYNSQTPEKKTKEETQIISEVKCGKVQKNSAAKFDQRLNIPALPPSNLTYCRILNVSYEVHVSASMSGFHSNPLMKIPITLGTIPLNIQHPSAPVDVSSPLPMTETILVSQPTVQSFEIPPPSYQEATENSVQLTEGNEDSTQSRPYHPMYPVYNFGEGGNNHQVQVLQMSTKPTLVVN